jgi:diguanylate cyclase (GGDEF)-like protein/PAS domain S-box-containing protein
MVGLAQQSDSISPAARRSATQLVALNAAMALTYFVAGKLGLQLAFVHASATAVWPPTGIAMAAALAFGPRIAPGIFLGAFLTNVTTAGSVATSLGIASGNTIEALLGAFLVHRFARGLRVFEHAPDVFRFVVYAAFIPTTISATIGVASLCLGGSLSWPVFGSVWTTWWIGDAMGALLFMPFLLAWNAGARVDWTPRKIAEGIVLLSGLTTVALMMSGFLLQERIGNAPLGFATIPFLLWAAFRFSPREAFGATFLLFSINLAGTLSGHGQFAERTPNASLLFLQGFSGFATVMTLFVSAVVAERTRAEQELRELNQELEQRVARALASLSESEQQYRNIFEHGLGLVCMHDLEGRLLSVNPAAAAASGFSPEELVGRSLGEFMSPRARSMLPLYLERVRSLGEDETILPVRSRGGEDRYWLCRSRLFERPGRPPEVVGYAIDITDRRRAQQVVADSERQYRELFDRSFAMVATHALDGTILSINPAGAAALGYAAEELLGTSLIDLMPEHLRNGVSAILTALPETGTGEGQVALRSRSAETRAFMYRHSWVAEARPPYVLAHALDITERLRAEAVLEHQAMHDPLTGCANRSLFVDRLHGAIAHAHRAQARGDPRCRVALLYLDLDEFKPVNDRLGHAAGDFVLREIAARLRARMREEDTAARLGGDEFCIVAGEIGSAEDALGLGESLLAAVREPLAWSGQEIRIGGSVGIALYPDHGDVPEALLARADQAMYSAKAEGRNRVRMA